LPLVGPRQADVLSVQLGAFHDVVPDHGLD
jgi:hypothetical protein